MSSASLRQLSTEKAVIHCDVDCFYCQVEVLDNPALAARPLAVHQGNSGGFVAVNYQVTFPASCGHKSNSLQPLSVSTVSHSLYEKYSN